MYAYCPTASSNSSAFFASPAGSTIPLARRTNRPRHEVDQTPALQLSRKSSPQQWRPPRPSCGPLVALQCPHIRAAGANPPNCKASKVPASPLRKAVDTPADARVPILQGTTLRSSTSYTSCRRPLQVTSRQPRLVVCLGLSTACDSRAIGANHSHLLSRVDFLGAS